MGAPPKCRLLPSVRAARASSDPVAHCAPRPQPRPAACAWCEEPPERGLSHCDDRTTWPRSVVPRTGLGPPALAVCSPPLPVHTQCSRSARALHAQCTCPQHEAAHKWRNTPAVRVAHRPSRTATMPAHAASPGPCRRSPGAAGLARATRLRSGARRGRICPLPRRRSPRRGRRSRRKRRGSRPRRPRRPSHSSPTRRARCSRANPKPHPHPHPHPRPKGAAHVLARGRTCTPQRRPRVAGRAEEGQVSPP